jgi:hypothetical protein
MPLMKLKKNGLVAWVPARFMHRHSEYLIRRFARGGRKSPGLRQQRQRREWLHQQQDFIRPSR